MEAIIFMGIQAVGKSSFYLKNYAHSHIRINLDMLKTRHREKLLFNCCIEMKQPFVIDNTNLTLEERARYIPLLQKNHFKIKGFYFSSKIEDSLRRNSLRDNSVKDKAILAAYNKLKLPSFSEGFVELFYVKLIDKDFEINTWEV